ncbi:antitoxin [Streptomyces sp. P9(2023)]|uniref:antitoxin n=1 Tax=Streptomyces sp. P9(2023) TaxID=3064394 RepID=UPI0028F41511|nr:antitoxin [Streptomyces sp. P9(2023)]MDT9692117.1 antitoxin [Streptomyces sp. P9(2023)]
MGIMDKLKGMMGQHPDKAQQGVERAGDTVDQRTGGKHAAKVDQAQQKAQEYIDKQRGQDQPPSPPPS